MTSLLDIGTRLVAARRACGLSQRELGERLAVRQQQIARWETTGYRTVTLARLNAVATALDVELVAAAAVLPLVAEAPATYLDRTRAGVAPVRDLGEIAARIREQGPELRGRYAITRVGVFGSFASGEQTPLSDVDLLVDVADPGGFRFVEAADFAERILGRGVDIARPHLLRERLRARVLGEAVYVWSA